MQDQKKLTEVFLNNLAPCVYTTYMFVRWQWWHQRRRVERWYRYNTPADAHAVLVESVRIAGKPQPARDQRPARPASPR